MAKLDRPGGEGPVDLVALGGGLTVTLLVIFLLCAGAALLVPGANFSHNWIGLFSTAPVGSLRSFIEGIIWSTVFAWVAAIIFAPVYNRIVASRS